MEGSRRDRPLAEEVYIGFTFKTACKNNNNNNTRASGEPTVAASIPLRVRICSFSTNLDAFGT